MKGLLGRSAAGATAVGAAALGAAIALAAGRCCGGGRVYIRLARGTSILGEVRNLKISRVTLQLLCSKIHDF